MFRLQGNGAESPLQSSVAGILLTALGVEDVEEYAGDSAALGWFYSVALCGGVAAYLVGHVWFQRLVIDVLSVARLVAAAAVLAMSAVVAATPALVGLAMDSAEPLQRRKSSPQTRSRPGTLSA